MSAARWELAIQVRGSYEEVLGAARWAESSGLEAFAVPDHYLVSGTQPEAPAWDHLIHLAGLARETTQIELVDLVSPVTFRHPAIYAKTAVTLADMSGGRFRLGLGTGWMEEEHTLFGFDFPDTSERFLMLEEALSYLDALAGGVGFAGRFYRLEEWVSAPPFDVPIVVGGSGLTKTPELAGRFAREFNLFPSTAEDISERIDRCLQAATLLGRAPEEIKLSFTIIPVAGRDEAGYRAALERQGQRFNRKPDRLAERLTYRGIPHGTVEQVRVRMNELAELGITRIYLQTGTTDVRELEEMVNPFLP